MKVVESLVVNVKVSISFWDAIKLRIAGMNRKDGYCETTTDKKPAGSIRDDENAAP